MSVKGHRLGQIRAHTEPGNRKTTGTVLVTSRCRKMKFQGQCPAGEGGGSSLRTASLLGLCSQGVSNTEVKT